ncbi:hypothetical protein CPAV1605_937 [seawater metagenome]|uniref:Uncharacterized protein n=1 Tax=seawater metagenome TaxID=1561972 RepID=A0A5E8CM07_9ZZZZ
MKLNKKIFVLIFLLKSNKLRSNKVLLKWCIEIKDKILKEKIKNIAKDFNSQNDNVEVKLCWNKEFKPDISLLSEHQACSFGYKYEVEQFSKNIPTLFYNPKLLKTLNINCFNTWEDFNEIKNIIKKNDLLSLTINNFTWSMIESFYATHDIEYCDNLNGIKSLPKKISITNKHFFNHLSYLYDLDKNNYIDLNLSDFKSTKTFLLKKTPFLIGSTSLLDTLKKYNLYDIDIKTSQLPYWNYLISKPKSEFNSGTFNVIFNKNNEYVNKLIEFTKKYNIMNEKDKNVLDYKIPNYFKIRSELKILKKNIAALDLENILKKLDKKFIEILK